MSPDQKELSPNIVSIIVTYNPKDLTLLELNVKRAREETRKVIVVDNASVNFDVIASICEKYQCDLIPLRFNSGISYALRRGVKHAIENYSPDWILFLDQDTFLLHGAIREAFSLYESMPEHVRKKIGILALSYRSFCNFPTAIEVIYNAFSGTLIRADVARIVNFRVNFFLDQADFDLYHEVRSKGYLTLLLCRKLIHHRIVIPMIIQIIYNFKLLFFKMIKIIGIRNLGLEPLPQNVSRNILFEPSERYYYIVRNSLILLKEKKKDFIAFLKDLVLIGMATAVICGILTTIKAFGLGVIHGLLRLEGILDTSSLKCRKKLTSD
ncbi:MAG: glycosyltransferase [Candidatus Geothermarchaeota archaeon]